MSSVPHYIAHLNRSVHSVCSVYGKTPDARCTLTLCSDQCASLVCSLGDESETRPGSGRYELVCAHSKLHTAKIQKYKIQKHKLQKYKLVCAYLKLHTVRRTVLNETTHWRKQSRGVLCRAPANIGPRICWLFTKPGVSPPHCQNIVMPIFYLLGINSPEMFSSLFLNKNYDWILR